MTNGYFFQIPFGQRISVKRALYDAEQAKGGPVYLVDIYREYTRTSYMPLKNTFVIFGCLQDLYMNDEILSDEKFDLLSLNPELQNKEGNPTKFRLCSDYFSIKYSKYDYSE